MRTLRIICVEADCGAAVNVGGPVHTEYKSFDVALPDDVAAWLEKRLSYLNRSIVGVELLPAVDVLNHPESPES